MSIFRSAVLAGTAIVAGAALYPAGSSSSVGETLETWYRNATGSWTEAACRDLPEACLRARASRLQNAQAGLDEAINSMRNQSQRIATLLQEREEVLESNRLMLLDGRRLLQAAAENPAAPITFMARVYRDEAELRTQVELLFRERASLTAVVSQARSQDQALRQGLEDLMVSRGEIRAALSMLPAQLEIIRANGILSELSLAVSSIDLSLNRQLEGVQSMLATTEDLMRISSRSATDSASMAGFQSFLNGGRLP